MTLPKRFHQLLVFLMTCLLPLTSFAEMGLNLPRGVTPVSQEIYDLHMTILWICVGIGVVVFGVMIYALIYHRKSVGHKPAEFHEHPSLEVVWAIIPFIILVIMAVPATRVLMAMDNTDDPDLTIKITGYQWKWRYEYLDNGISFYANMTTPIEQILNQTATKEPGYLAEVDNVLVLPTEKKIRFLVTANDVIHSWWVPELGIKRDGIPGFIHQSWARIDKPGTYHGQCAELCGINHAFMPIVVKAVPPAEFNQWVAEKTGEAARAKAEEDKKEWTKEELMALGKKTYDKICAACHKVDGSGQPPIFPAMKGSSVAVGKPISRHIDIILNGVPGSAMQAFASQLNDAELAAVVTYERNAFENNTGDVVQPKEVKAERNKQ